MSTFSGGNFKYLVAGKPLWENAPQTSAMLFLILIFYLHYFCLFCWNFLAIPPSAEEEEELAFQTLLPRERVSSGSGGLRPPLICTALTPRKKGRLSGKRARHLMNCSSPSSSIVRQLVFDSPLVDRSSLGKKRVERILSDPARASLFRPKSIFGMR